MTSRVSIFNHSGQYLTEVNTTFKREYKLNEFGTGSFTLSTSDPKCREDYLELGNFVYVEHPKLPAWGGMIDTPRVWGQGQVMSTAYSAEYILTCMVTANSLSISGTFGSLFQQMIEQMFNNDIGNVIKIGSIFGGGPTVSRKYNYASLYTEIKQLCADSGNDFDLSPEIDGNGKLYFSANWYEKRGMLKQYTLYEDTNIKLSTMPLREQGRIANKLRIYGQGATTSSRALAQRTSETSISKYGERWLSETSQGDDLEANADALLKEKATPRKTFDITVLDDELNNIDNYRQCRVGDQLPVSFHSVGFSGSGFGTNEIVRILQMAFDEENNQLKLVADQMKT